MEPTQLRTYVVHDLTEYKYGHRVYAISEARAEVIWREKNQHISHHNIRATAVEDLRNNFTIETKCRRCGGLNEWESLSYSLAEFKTDWLYFERLVTDMLREPRQQYCKGCGKETVQDLVSYMNYREAKSKAS